MPTDANNSIFLSARDLRSGCNFRHPAWLSPANNKNMNTTARTLISASTAAALGLFALISAIFTGLGSTATITGISLYVALGMIEIMIHSYAPSSNSLRRPHHRVIKPSTSSGRSVVVPFRPASDERKAA